MRELGGGGRPPYLAVSSNAQELKGRARVRQRSVE